MPCPEKWLLECREANTEGRDAKMALEGIAVRRSHGWTKEQTDRFLHKVQETVFKVLVL